MVWAVVVRLIQRMSTGQRAFGDFHLNYVNDRFD
jgi:hypothetical protein